MRRPPAINPTPVAAPIQTRMSGVIRLRSNDHFTKKATPRKSARPPAHANNLIPRKFSIEKGSGFSAPPLDTAAGPDSRKGGSGMFSGLRATAIGGGAAGTGNG